MAGFRYLLASTVTVQKIMQENSRVLDQKIKKRTERLLSKNKSKKSLKSENENKSSSKRKNPFNSPILKPMDRKSSKKNIDQSKTHFKS